jgi:hypothetical protein
MGSGPPAARLAVCARLIIDVEWSGHRVVAWRRERQLPNHWHALPLTACVAFVMPAFGAENLFDGTYTGERVLTAGDPAACVAKDAASATIQGDELTFSHSAVTDYTISFSPRADGAFVQLSANISGIVVDIRGHIGAGVLDADVTSASCAHH